MLFYFAEHGDAEDSDAGLKGFFTDRTLTQEDCDALNGPAGIAADLATTFYRQQLDDSERRQSMLRMLLRLVDVEEGRYARRSAVQAEFAYPNP